MRLFPFLATLPLLVAVAGLSLADEPATWRQGEDLPTLSKNGPVQRLAFSPDGRRLVTAQRRNITLWDLASRKPVAAIEDVNVNVWYQFCCFTSDNRAWFLTQQKSEPGRAEIALVDLETRKTRAVFTISQPWTNPALSHDGRYLAYVSNNDAHYNKVVLHSVETGEQIDILPGAYSGPIGALTFSPDSRSLVAGHRVSYRYNDGRVTVWDMATRKRSFSLKEPKGAGPVAVSGNNKAVAWGRHDDSVSVADLATGKLGVRVENSSGNNPSGKTPSTCALAVLSDVNLVAVGSGEDRPRLVIWHLSEPVKEVATLLAGARGVTAFAVSPDGQTVLAGQEDGQVLVFSASKPKASEQLKTEQLKEGLDDLLKNSVDN
jgi:WD40 repeat protein